MKYLKFCSALVLGTTLLGAPACVDADLDDALEYDDTYTDVGDADKHIIGVYAQFMSLAEQMVVLNELRGDLMDITDNANTYLQEVDAKVADEANPYLNPTPYYNVIKECNDCIDNFGKMRDRHDMTDDEYNERYSDIAALRCYVYLQLAAQFGEVYYITEPIASVADMQKFSSSKPITLTELLPQLIQVMENLPFMNPYEESPLVYNDVNQSATTLSGELLSFYFVHKKLLLADLYLWNNQFREAALLYKAIMDQNSDKDDSNNYQLYKCATAINPDQIGEFYQSSLSRFKSGDVNSFKTIWPDMFSDALTAKAATYEWIWTITFPEGTTPQYPFIDLFASTADGGSYQLRPSSRCVYNFARLDRTRRNDAPYDTRGDSATYRVTASGDTVCAKYLYMYDPSVPYEQEGRWWLYRAPMVHLRFAECMNRLGYPELAWAFITEGLSNYYGNSYPSGVTRTSDPRDFQTNGHNLFHLLKPVTMGVCDNEQDSSLLFFDTRFYTKASDNPFDGIVRRGPWRQHGGLRNGRACMNPVYTSDFALGKSLGDAGLTKADSIYIVEKILFDEAALELAHEGNRFPDLVRFARRMNTTTSCTVNGQTLQLTNDGMDGTTFFQEVMAKKAAASRNVLGQPDYSAGESSWYLSYK